MPPHGSRTAVRPRLPDPLPMVAAGLVDELLIYLAPKLLGRDAREMFSFNEPEKLADAMQFDLHDVTRIGYDILVMMRAK